MAFTGDMPSSSPVPVTAPANSALVQRSSPSNPYRHQCFDPTSSLGASARPVESWTLLEALGTDEISVLEFDRALAARTPEDFLFELKERTGLIELWVGEGFALGRDRVGDVTESPKSGDAWISNGSDAARGRRRRRDQQFIDPRAIESGDVRFAAASLGRPFSVAGEVIHGAHLGREIGFPTANFFPPEGLVQLGDGIFVSLVLLAGESAARPAMTYVGTRPTINSGVRQIETHLLDFDGDLYGQTIEVAMLQKIRDDQQFSNLDAMIERLAVDEAHARAVLARRETRISGRESRIVN